MKSLLRPAPVGGGSAPRPAQPTPALAPTGTAPFGRVDLGLLAGFLVLAFILRVWGVSWNLPYETHPDEPNIVNAAVRIIKSGDLNPHYNVYPALVIYIQTLIDRLNLAWGTWRGYYSGPASLPDSSHLFALAPELFLWGRTYSALVGAATVAGCFVVGRAMFGRIPALVAGLLLLTSATSIEQSHYLVTDSTLAACGVLTLALAWLLAARPGVRRALLAGASVGLAAAAKYDGLFVGLVAALAWLLAWPRWRPGAVRAGKLARWLLVAAGMLGAAAVAFALINPFMILDWAAWSKGFRTQFYAYFPATGLADMITSFSTQLRQLWAAESIVLAGGVLGSLVLVVDAVRRRRESPALVRAAWLLVPFPPIHLLLLSRFLAAYERNMLITLPFLCLALGYGVMRLAVVLAGFLSRYARRPGPDPAPPAGARPAARLAPVLALALGVLLALEPGRQALSFDNYMAAPDTRNLAWDWLQTALRDGHRAAAELYPWQTCAPDPHPCLAPDVLAADAQINRHAPAWYAARGFDYVVMLGPAWAVLGNPAQRGPRRAAQMAPFRALPVVKQFAGDDQGGKGPDVLVLQVAEGLNAMAGVVHSGARFGDLAELAAFAFAPVAKVNAPYDPAAVPSAAHVVQPGGVLAVSLYWRALPGSAERSGTWQELVRVVSAAGVTVAQVDATPLSSGHVRPPRAWYPNEFLVSTYYLTLPAATPLATYRLSVAFHDAPSGPFLPVRLSGQADSPTLDLGTIAVSR